MSHPIPQPPSIPFLGNVTSLDKEVPLRSFLLLSEEYGEIYQLNLLGRIVISVNSYALGAEVSDDKRFKKAIGNSLLQVRNLISDGLFTAYNEEPNWAVAHRLLIPAFGTVAIHGMLEDMRDISDQLMLKWARFGPEHIIDPTDDFTRVALDTLAYCAMSYRLNSFYSEQPPAFAQSMVDFLKECFARSTRPNIVQAMMPSATAKYQDDIKLMRDLADKMVSDRRAHPTTKKDLLNSMLNGKDPKTGESLSDANISNNLLTFLIAGHETSSGTLSFVVYYLLKNPETMSKLRAEIDEVLGDRPVQYEDLSKLQYLNAVLRETLRLAATAPARSVQPLEDTTLGNGKYAVKTTDVILIQTWPIHRDPAVWGEDADVFRPERMLDENFKALPPNAWQPFGYGLRGCIGRPFAWQEMQLILATIMQRFDLLLADPSYTLDIQQALTVKPKGFYIRATPRAREKDNRFYATPSSGLMQARDTSAPSTSATPSASSVGTGQPLYVLYGSNTGTSESFAQRIVSDAPTHGFRGVLGTLDSAEGHIPTDGPVIIVTASFEGEPADNAAHFIHWLETLQGNELEGVEYAVFGCGNHDWVQTFQRIPTLCDDLFEKRGGKRLLPRGVGDAGSGDFFQVFDEYETQLWETLCKKYESSRSDATDSGFAVKTVDPGTQRATTLRQPDAALGRVVENRLLTKPGAPMKRHIEFELPEGMTYRAGDYLAILPHNPPRDVHRVLAHFSLSKEQQIVVSSVGPTSFPVDKPVTLSEILGGYVELSQPATTRDLRVLADAAALDTTRSDLSSLQSNYPDSVLGKRLSVLDILEKYPDIKVSLTSFLQMLPPMRVRQYSISSSPLWNPQHVTLTLSVIEAPSISGVTSLFLGVASNYLKGLLPGDRVQMAVRPSGANFHPPADPMTPVVMFCAGSGLAPMRGFMQERAAQKQSGREVATMLLFYGCRSPEEDYLYSDSDLKEWVEMGVVDVRPAFSRSVDDSKGCKYVQDRIWHDQDAIHKAYADNAKFFACGSGVVAKGIKSKLIELLHSVFPEEDDAEVLAKFERITKGRYVADVFD